MASRKVTPVTSQHAVQRIEDAQKQNLPKQVTPDGKQVLVSRDPTLHDILHPSPSNPAFGNPIPDVVAVVLDGRFTSGDAERLAIAISSLATRIADIRQFNFILLCVCSRLVGTIVAKALEPLRGLKNIALKLNKHPGEPGAHAQQIGLNLRYATAGSALPFAKLPSELRQEVLSYCLLLPGNDTSILISPDIVKAKPVCCKRCLPSSAVNSGYCACSKRVGGYSSLCVCQKHTFAAFRVCRQMYRDSTAVCFRQNRFVLHGLMESLNFLQNLPYDALYSIRRLDLLIKYKEFHMFTNKTPLALDKIVYIIWATCNLSTLHLSLDFGPDEPGEHFTYKGGLQPASKFEAGWLEEPMDGILPPFWKLRGVNRFEVFLSMCPDFEDQVETWMMGDDYDAAKLGKIPYEWRDAADPHRYVAEDSDVVAARSAQWRADSPDSWSQDFD